VTNCRWQTVPHDWPGHRESSVAKFRPRTWNRVVGAGRRAELIACRIIVAVGVYRIGQVMGTDVCGLITIVKTGCAHLAHLIPDGKLAFSAPFP